MRGRDSEGLWLVIFDLTNGVQQFLQDDEGLFGMGGRHRAASRAKLIRAFLS